MKEKPLLLIFFVVFLLGTQSSSVVAQKVDSVEIKNMSDRLRDLLCSRLSDSGTISNLLRSMEADGSWKEINYQNTNVLWHANTHLAYLFNIAKAYASHKSLWYKNENLEIKIHKSLNFWLNHNFTSQNWWYNDIGIPDQLSNILILMGETITQDELLRAFNQMRGSYISQKGQNRVWRAGIQLKIGILQYGRGHVNLLGSAMDRIENSSKVLQQEVVISEGEGIQPDWSFHQHGTQLQFGNYGLTFAASEIEWAWVLKGSRFQYSEDKIDILRNYLLKGLSRVVWKGAMDISGNGRSFAPNSAMDMGMETMRVLRLMSRVDTKNAQKYFSYIDCLQGKSELCTILPQSVYFWRSAFMVHRNSNFYLSIRMHSKFIQSTESGIGQNLSGALLADGATYLYQSGKEYQNILPIWDWRRIPGITSFAKESLPEVGWSGLPNESNFVGGVSDSSFGVATMLFKRDSLTAHKSWFISPQGVVCLGAGIQSEKNTQVSTILNQSFLSGDVIVKKGESKIRLAKGGELNSPNVDWIYHDYTGYIFLKKEKVHVSSDRQVGNWKKVYSGGSEDSIVGQVFNLWIDHGSNPGDETYAYAIFPNMNKDSVDFYAHYPSQKILKNDTQIQAVQFKEKGITQAVFYEPGELNLYEDLNISASDPCILMIKRVNGEIGLTISSPPEDGEIQTLNADGHPENNDLRNSLSPGKVKTITISVNGHYRGNNCVYDLSNNQTKVKFDLPGNGEEVKSVMRIISNL